MATVRMHEDQKNRGTVDVRGRGKENIKPVTAQTQPLQQTKRTVLGTLHNNCPRNTTKTDFCKDEKYLKVKLITQHEPFKVYEDKEPVFKIYEDKLEEETSVVLRDSKNMKETKPKQEVVSSIKSNREQLRLEEDTSNLTVFCNQIKENIKEKDEDDGIFLKDSPMSLDKSLPYTNSSTKSLRTRDYSSSSKDLESSFYNVDEYRNDIYNYLRAAETVHRPKPGYMRKQPDITYAMRSILVDWLVEVTEEYQLQTETLYLAISYIDRFLSYMSVVRTKLQLVGTAAMFIAAKFEEIYAPDIREFVYITADTYTKKHVLRMENLILRVLAFDLSVPTTLAFLMEFCINNNLSDKIKFLAMYLCELSLLEGDPYLQYLPSHVAAAAVALARHTLQEEIWPDELELSTGYNLKCLKECISHLNRTFSNAPNLDQQAIQEKYRNSKYGHVSLLLPRSTEAISCEDGSDDESA